MNQKNEQGLFQVLEDILRNAEQDEALDCATLFDMPAVREHAATVNRVSDYLGNMWRKGLVLRVPAPKLEGTKARWMYLWKEKGPKQKPKADLTKAVEFNPSLDRIVGMPNLDITDDGKTISIILPELLITIQRRPS
jgi:hypothetical protein